MLAGRDELELAVVIEVGDRVVPGQLAAGLQHRAHLGVDERKLGVDVRCLGRGLADRGRGDRDLSALRRGRLCGCGIGGSRGRCGRGIGRRGSGGSRSRLRLRRGRAAAGGKAQQHHRREQKADELFSFHNVLLLQNPRRAVHGGGDWIVCVCLSGCRWGRW